MKSSPWVAANRGTVSNRRAKRTQTTARVDDCTIDRSQTPTHFVHRRLSRSPFPTPRRQHSCSLPFPFPIPFPIRRLLRFIFSTAAVFEPPKTRRNKEDPPALGPPPATTSPSLSATIAAAVGLPSWSNSSSYPASPPNANARSSSNASSSRFARDPCPDPGPGPGSGSGFAPSSPRTRTRVGASSIVSVRDAPASLFPCNPVTDLRTDHTTFPLSLSTSSRHRPRKPACVLASNNRRTSWNDRGAPSYDTRRSTSFTRR